MRVALVHDWLTGMRGGERVLEALLDLFPDASVHTLVHVPGSVTPRIESRVTQTSWLQGVPGAGTWYRHLLPLLPRAVESLDVGDVDLVVSSSHCVAKGVPTPPGARHLCYCHTPMRYVWDQEEAYFGPGRAAPWVRAAMKLAAPRLRAWDVRTADRPDALVANSTFVRERIRRVWGRDAAVVHPPVDLERFAPAAKEDYYLVMGASAPYKRTDLAVEAARRMGRRLVVVGGTAGAGGAERDGVRRIGRVPDERVAALLAGARALLLPGVEDFGIGVVEALASGTPVVALGRGGVRDIVHPPETGVFFDEPTVEALVDAMRHLEAARFDTDALVAAARPFGRDRFLTAMRARVDALLDAPLEGM